MLNRTAVSENDYSRFSLAQILAFAHEPTLCRWSDGKLDSDQPMLSLSNDPFATNAIFLVDQAALA